MTATSQSLGATSPGLERDAIGLPEVLFQSITHMAPAVATALSIGAATTFAGGITPLAVLFAMIACLFTAYSIGELARHLPSAGGMYTYVGRGLGPLFGWLMAWAFALAEPLVAPILFAAFGLFGGVFLASYLGIDFTYSWAILAAVCGVLIWWLLYSGITFSTRTGVLPGLIEIGVFIFISALLIVNAGPRNTLSVFVPGEEGVLPALQGMVFSLLAFIGFEAAAPLGEEARDPKRTIRQAVIWSTILIGAFYAFNYYAATVFFGPERMLAEFYTFNDGDPWGWMAEQVVPGVGGLLIIFAILNSSVANANSGATAATRAIFSMGRAGLLPRWFAAVHPERRTPINAIHAQIVVGTIIAVGLGLILADDPFPASAPLNVYVFLGYMLGLLFAGMYIAVNVAAIGLYLRERRDEFNVVKHIVVPVLGVIFMIPAFLSVIGGLTIPILQIELPALSGALSWMAPIVAAWMVLGIVLYLMLRLRSPEALNRIGEVYGGETPPSEPSSWQGVR